MGDYISWNSGNVEEFRNFTDSDLGSRETELHHEIDQDFFESFSNDVSKVCTYFTQKGHSYNMLEPKFYNITSEEIFPDIPKKV